MQIKLQLAFDFNFLSQIIITSRYICYYIPSIGVRSRAVSIIRWGGRVCVRFGGGVRSGSGVR